MNRRQAINKKLTREEYRQLARQQQVTDDKLVHLLNPSIPYVEVEEPSDWIKAATGNKPQQSIL